MANDNLDQKPSSMMKRHLARALRVFARIGIARGSFLGIAGVIATTWINTEYRFGTDPISYWRYPMGEARSFQAHEEWLSGLRFSQDGTALITKSASQSYLKSTDSVRVWDVETLEEQRRLTDSSGLDFSLDVTADLQRFATVGSSPAVKVFGPVAGDREQISTGSASKTKVPSHKRRQILLGRDGIMRSPVLSPDGQIIAGAQPQPDQQWQVKFWDAQTGELQRSVGPLLESSIFAIAFSRSGDQLAIASANTVYLWDLAEDRQLQTVTVPLSGRTQAVGFEPAITDLSFSEDDAVLVAEEYGELAARIETATGAIVESDRLDSPMPTEEDSSTDSRTRLVFEGRPTINVYDVQRNQIERVYSHVLPNRGQGLTVNLSDDGETFLVRYVRSSNQVKLVSIIVGDIASGEIVQTLTMKLFLSGSDLNSNGKTLAVFQGSSVELWDIKTGERLDELMLQKPRSQEKPFTGGRLKFSPDGTLLLTNNTDAFQLWNVESKELLWTADYVDDMSVVPAINASNTLILASCRQRNFCLLSAQTGELLRRFPIPAETESPAYLAFSSDGKTFAIGDYFGRVVLQTLPTKIDVF